jgi:hypothetical protein
MDQYLEAAEVATEKHAVIAGTYFEDFAATWYSMWKKAKELKGEPLTWSELSQAVTKDLTPKDPEWAARLSMAKMEYRGNLKNHITFFHELSEDASDMGIPD